MNYLTKSMTKRVATMALISFLTALPLLASSHAEARVADSMDKETQSWCLVQLGDELWKMGNNMP